MIEWRQIALEYPCQTCGAAPGEECITISGRVAHTPHQWRSGAASANRWHRPEPHSALVVGDSTSSSPVRSQ
jgi:hypothetical protein